MEIDPHEATFWQHVEALRQTLIQILLIVFTGFFASFWFYKELFELVLIPLKDSDISLIALGPLEGLSAALKLSFFSGLLFTSPFWLYSVMKFIAPAFDFDVKKLFFSFCFLTILLASFGFAFAFWITIPLANEFLAAFNSDISSNLWSIQYYFDYTLTLLVGHILVFEGAAILLFLIHFGFLTPQFMRQKRSHAIVLILIIAALLTPPDILTQIMLSIPMIGLYELLIIYGTIRKKALDLQRESHLA